jgi:hypothetical protein
VRLPEPSFAHIIRLTDDKGIFEHAEGMTPRRDGGYCLDDAARALLVVCRQRPAEPELERLATAYLSFVLRAMTPDGRFHNRLDRHGRWEDQPDTGDWWGRALWGLGTAAARGPLSIRATAAKAFGRAATQRSPHLHAMAFATLGAAPILAVDPSHARARELMVDLVAMVDPASAHGPRPVGRDWPWPLPRLTYADAAITEALIAAGTALGEDAVTAHGLALLEWLLTTQTVNGHLSVTPVGGWGPGEFRARFDQQPIEAAALADACARAFARTGERRWAYGLERSVAWFLGDNDAGIAMHDPDSGGGYDAVTPHGRNTNQGAESTLALISALQHAKRISAPESGCHARTNLDLPHRSSELHSPIQFRAPDPRGSPRIRQAEILRPTRHVSADPVRDSHVQPGAAAKHRRRGS